MSNKIENEIAVLAENMEKSIQDPREVLTAAIAALGPTELKKALSGLNPEELALVKSSLEAQKEALTMKKAVSFDKEAQAVKYVKGNINDTILQEDKVDDDADEKLVKPEAAKMDHQGTPTDGWEGQVVKGEKPMDKKEIKAIADKEAKEEVQEHEGKMHEKKEKEMKKAEKEEKCMEPMAKKEDEAEGKEAEAKKDPKAKMLAKLREMKKALEAELGAEASPELIKGKMKAMMQEMEADESEEKDEPKESKAEEKSEGKEKPEPKKESKAKEEKPEMKKAIWEEPNALLKALTGGRNHNFSVNGYYDEVLKQAASPLDEKLNKSGNFPTPKEDLNEIIAKSEDRTWGEIETDRLVKSAPRTGALIKSFENNEIAAALGLTEEEAKALLGEE